VQAVARVDVLVNSASNFMQPLLDIPPVNGRPPST
jgi:hypothetical protein